jgi:16S rRNA (cytidine1402-2'-O)-methyltransferase
MVNRKAIQKSGALFIVATPIGNKEDITVRALRILKEVDFIAAEDTRKTRRLLAYHNINGRFISYHEHNETERTEKLIGKLKQGTSIALVTNAGTPVVSDPGYPLIQAAIGNEIRIIPIPGVSAAVTALSAAGLPTDSFLFIGFVARKQNKRLKQLRELTRENRTLIFFESPRRIRKLLVEIVGVLGDRYAVLAREMTKRYEEFIRGRLSEIQNHLNKQSAIKGELTLLVSGKEVKNHGFPDEIKKELESQLIGDQIPLSEIVKRMVRKYGVSKNKVYTEALNIKSKRS